MRRLNRALVLQALVGQGTTSRAALAKETLLTKPTVSAIVEDLIREGLVRELGVGEASSEGGRRPMLLEFNVRSRFFLGIHIGVQQTNLVVGDALGNEVARDRFRTPRRKANDLIAMVVERARALLDGVRGSRRRLAAVGVCLPGLVDGGTGICLLAPNLGWRDVPVGAILATQLGVPVEVHNTSQACAIAEAAEGAGRGEGAIALLYAGTGVGAGLVTAGALWPGASGIAGEIGHSPIPGSTIKCRCGKVGCLETVASGAAIVRLARAAGVPIAARSGRLEDVVAASQRGDDRAQAVIDDALGYLGMAAAWLVNLTNPAVLILGGGMAEAPGVQEAFATAVQQHALPQSTAALRIERWGLGQDAKVRGAIHVAMRSTGDELAVPG